jgi:hypothetical protein
MTVGILISPTASHRHFMNIHTQSRMGWLLRNQMQEDNPDAVGRRHRSIPGAPIVKGPA